MATLRELNSLLDTLEQSEHFKGPFIGNRVQDAVRNAKYSVVWSPLIERYIDLLLVNVNAGRATTFATHFYCDLACTIITKKVMMVDLFYLYEPQEKEDVELTRLREAHMITATKYLAKMFTCIYECVHGGLPHKLHVAKAASLLYAEMYAEAFNVSAVREEDIFILVEKWFCANILKPELGSFHNTAPGIPFLFCSHVYWLWLHLTAARVRHSAQDLLTVIYALDTIIYCDECKKHFLQLRAEFFFDHWDGETKHCFSNLSNEEILFDMHNKINIQSGSSEIDVAVLSEYKRYWERIKGETG